ncbi:Homoserine kinase [hydrothermal vent metagenome]|uniref:Homoserine kinase n=1 Tax=hydrothermal vent metagenome TaxID=652676 RepID=A0A3B0UDL5_9ZZZZ
MPVSDMPPEDQPKLLAKLANQALCLWDLPPAASAKLINVSENSTYLVKTPAKERFILRIHRQNYHSQRAIECELEWKTALGSANIVTTPRHYLGKNGKAIQSGHVTGLASPRFMVLFEYLKGSPPDEKGDLFASFEELGEIAARLHNHSLTWPKPANFERLSWDIDAIFGPRPTWGNWRHAPGVDAQIATILEQVEKTIRHRLQTFGKNAKNHGLIHADMRLANLLINDNRTQLIDFDDCGFGWFLYDFAAAVSFMEDDPRIQALKAVWVRGYRKERDLSAAEETEIDSFIMLRRMALLAWIGSHKEAPEPQALAPHFARITAELGHNYLERFSNSARARCVQVESERML